MATAVHFEWDVRKHTANLRKHGVDFGAAARVFADPLVELEIEGTEHGEVRFRAIGEVDGRVLVVSYTWCEDSVEEVIRIISARKATPRERRAYEGDS